MSRSIGRFMLSMLALRAPAPTLVPILTLLCCGAIACSRSRGFVQASDGIWPASASVMAGGPGLKLISKLGGEDRWLGWSLSGPGSLSAPSATEVRYIPPAEINGTSSTATVTVSSVSLGRRASSTIVLVAREPVDVVGRVVGQNGVPIANALVTVSGQPAATTGEDGVFRLPAVLPPYDVSVVVPVPDEWGQRVRHTEVFRGLTRPNPLLAVDAAGSCTARVATISGMVSRSAGWPAPLSAGFEVTPVISDAQAFAAPGGSSGQVDPSTGELHVEFRWCGPESVTGSIGVFEVEREAEGMLLGFPGYGTASGLLLTAGTTTTPVNVVLGPGPPSAIASGHLTVPPAWTVISITGYSGLDPESTVAEWFNRNELPAFAFLLPAPPGASATISAYASSADWSGNASTEEVGIALGASDVSVVLLPPPEQIAPFDRETASSSTQFSWTPFPEAVYTLTFSGQINSHVHCAQAFVHTMETSTTLGSEPCGAFRSWGVAASGPWASIDDYTDPATAPRSTYRAGGSLPGLP